jgi:hypothetical protein
MRRFPVALAVLLLTGCFGDGGDPQPGTSADFVKQVNRICRESDIRFKALGKPPERDTPSYAQYVRDTQTIVTEVTAKVRRVPASRDLDPLLRQWRKEIDVLLRRGRSVRRATARVDADRRASRLSSRAYEAHLEASIKALGLLQASVGRLDRLTRRAGLTECVRRS